MGLPFRALINRTADDVKGDNVYGWEHLVEYNRLKDKMLLKKEQSDKLSRYKLFIHIEKITNVKEMLNQQIIEQREYRRKELEEKKKIQIDIHNAVALDRKEKERLRLEQNLRTKMVLSMF